LRKGTVGRVRDEWRQYLRQGPPCDDFSPFSTAEIEAVLGEIKVGTAAGYDNIFPEFLTHLGPVARRWLSSFFSRVVLEGRTPNAWRQAKVIAVSKPGKDPHEAASYRPISLLSVCFKAMERLILNRINPTVDEVVVIEQAGFRRGRSTCDQVLALTTYIENGFQSGLKTGAVFLDLTAAYDTVWHRGLLVKLAAVLPRWVVMTVEMFLQNRRFRVHMGDRCSAWRTQLNGLPQGSVLSPCLFNLYINDMPDTRSRRFVYADDVALGAQGRSFEEVEEILNADVELLAEYFSEWRLKPSVAKTVASAFHLHNAQAARELDIRMNGQRLRHEPKPTYLGVTLDRSLTFHEHLERTAAKVGARNNLLSKLAGTTWGSRATTLRTAALALCYSTVEYCAPVWARSAHTGRVDVKLHETMRLITGTLRSSPLPWLPVLSNIPPPHLRRAEACARMLAKVRMDERLPLHADIAFHPGVRLPSRHPIWRSPPEEGMAAISTWREEWATMEVVNHSLVVVPSAWPPGGSLPRHMWKTLNRFRTDQGRCAVNLVRWGQSEDPLCCCGERQTMSHIVNECRLLRFPGGLPALHLAEGPAAATWLGANCIR